MTSISGATTYPSSRSVKEVETKWRIPRSRQGAPGPTTGNRRRKYCFFCKEDVEKVDYKDFGTLRRFMSERGKIRSRRTTGACRRHQRQVAVAIKRAREVALLPYSSR